MDGDDVLDRHFVDVHAKTSELRVERGQRLKVGATRREVVVIFLRLLKVQGSFVHLGIIVGVRFAKSLHPHFFVCQWPALPFKMDGATSNHHRHKMI